MPYIANKRKHRGMTLIEVLIAATIVAAGLLGVASLQIKALQDSANADYRARAIDFATSLSDRMQANLIAVADNDYLESPECEAASETAVSNCSMTPIMSTSSSVEHCTPQQMARFDLQQISCGPGGIAESLPNGQLRVTCLDVDTSDADLCSDLSRLLIRISWQQQTRMTDIAPDEVDEIVMTVVIGAP